MTYGTYPPPHYQRVIAQRLAELEKPDVDPRLIEAWMRVEHPTLDHLTPAEFNDEIDVALVLLSEGGVAEAEALARSYGL